MSALAAKQHQPESATHHRSAISELTALEARHDSRLPSFTPAIQRTPVCPCGGGCPGCRTIIQPKLEVGQQDDEYEREADRVADEVMRMPEPRKQSAGSDQPSVFSDQSSVAGGRHSSFIAPRSSLSRAPSGAAGIEVAPEVEAQIQSLRGGGRPLSESERAFFEPRFGHDFSRVRIHDDVRAAETARAVNAIAFTAGQDVVLGEGQFAPGSDNGRRLVAHELVHVGQQTDARANHVHGRCGPSPLSLLRLMIQRDLAVEPTAPGAVGRELTPGQMRTAISWNQAALADTDEIALLRDVLGISSEPSVIDEDFVRALVRYQANFGLTQDGLLGAATAGRLAGELGAEATYLGADADVGTATEMALNPAQRRMRLRSRVVSRLGRMLHQGFIGPRDNPTGIVTVRSGFSTAATGTAASNQIGINYTGSNEANSRWLQFTFSQMSAIDPATKKRAYGAGSVTTSGGTYDYSDAVTFNWNVDTVPATGSMYYEAGGASERTAGSHTEIFDQPRGWNTAAETYAASFATRPANVRLIKGFDTYLVVSNNSVVYHVRWNLYFSFNTAVTPTPDVTGTYEVLSAGAASKLPADRKTRLDAQFPGNTVP